MASFPDVFLSVGGGVRRKSNSFCRRTCTVFRLDRCSFMDLKFAIARTTSVVAVKTQHSVIRSVACGCRRGYRRFVPLIVLAFLALPSRAHASLFHGETLDAIANGISWVVLVIAPIIGVA